MALNINPIVVSYNWRVPRRLCDLTKIDVSVSVVTGASAELDQFVEPSEVAATGDMFTASPTAKPSDDILVYDTFDEFEWSAMKF